MIGNAKKAIAGVNDPHVAKIALLGTGTVGRAVLARLDEWNRSPIGERLRLVYAGNSRAFLASPDGVCPVEAAERLPAAIQTTHGPDPEAPLVALGGEGIRILIDATADESVASAHVLRLGDGIHVATACKLAAGTSLHRWRAIQQACAAGDTSFGDRATVGAGLPLIRSIRELRDGGDRIHAIAGVMSGSLAWLFDRFDGRRTFSDLVREARDKGYTEPDPREDLSGEDVRRKILILVRAAGFAIDQQEVEVTSLVPPDLAAMTPGQALDRLRLLDGPLEAALAEARACGGQLRFVARFDGGKAKVGLERLCADDPLLGGRGTDNRVAIWSDRYRQQPLVIQGPGAGAEVTAAALLDDVLQLRSRAIGSGLARHGGRG